MRLEFGGPKHTASSKRGCTRRTSALSADEIYYSGANSPYSATATEPLGHLDTMSTSIGNPGLTLGLGSSMSGVEVHAARERMKGASVRIDPLTEPRDGAATLIKLLGRLKSCKNMI
jgi:hypothetical protein